MSGQQSPRKKGEASVAAFLTWFIPGAGHLYLGRPTQAVVAFVLVEGLYAVGWLLSGGRTFEFLDPELRGPLATVLTPEVGNLGAMIAQMRAVGYGVIPPSPYPALIHLGSILAATSGFLTACWMAHAHGAARGLDERPGGTRPVIGLVACWILPGLGHWLQGRRLRAVIVCALLLGLFFWGTWLADGSNLSRERHFYYWSGQFLLGLPAIVTEILSGRPPVTEELPFVDAGLLFACLAGLLNVLAMLDVYGVAERRLTGEAPAASPAPGEGGAA
jgi:TM2 domain-containing membrane protein YozV